MSSEQLTLLDLPALAPASSRRRGTRRSSPSRPATPAPAAPAAGGEVVVEVRFPEALVFLREHGPEAVAVLQVLAVDAEQVDGRFVVRASTRGLAQRLGFLSKDSVHRRLRQLRRAGVIEPLPSTGAADVPSYVLHLDGTGLTVVRNG